MAASSTMAQDEQQQIDYETLRSRTRLCRLQAHALRVTASYQRWYAQRLLAWKQSLQAESTSLLVTYAYRRCSASKDGHR